MLYSSNGADTNLLDGDFFLPVRRIGVEQLSGEFMLLEWKVTDKSSLFNSWKSYIFQSVFIFFKDISLIGILSNIHPISYVTEII